ncbi:copper homeostasis membrane protein CopD [Phenylobacterium sp.]|uniref:copper homeostasis membrane protein CopD n=1 Tax=Phenylobacterium sp. TaxID=1871053 RepID=UPI0025CC4C96|nr:copper homeostasis membrane protein CopD [Phenylobacterium sp.]
MEAAAVLARLLQYLAVAAVGGGSLFVIGDARRPGPTLRLVRGAAAAGALGVVAWLMAQMGQIGDAPSDAFDVARVWSLATETGFGRAALLRLALLTAAGLLTLRSRAQPAWRTLALLGCAAAATFAWTGHGASDDGFPGLLHLTADVLHALAATAWIGALFVLAERLRGPDVRLAADSLRAFSRRGIAIVAVIAVTGTINSWFLVGLNGVAHLAEAAYGRLLLVKLAVFGLMLALAAANRYRLSSALDRALATGDAGQAKRAVALSVGLETLLAVAVLALVSWMGTVPPTAHAGG